MRNDFTEGSIPRVLMRFSVPYLISCFLQTFYGLADLFITGQFYDESVITAVSNGSQVMHMLTVIIAGLAMGSTIFISRSAGAGKSESVAKGIGNSVSFFLLAALVFTVLCMSFTGGIITALSVPEVSAAQTRAYLMICFAGIPFITAYNVISSIFRGLGDTRSPMYFVAAAGVINVVLDYILIGPCRMGAAGAAAATVTAQAVSVILAFYALRKMLTKNTQGSAAGDPQKSAAGAKGAAAVTLTRQELKPDRRTISGIASVGVPIAFQDGLVQISFLIISVIANRRGAEMAAAVGIVEKIISFLFLVPSAMLSTISVAAAQNAGAGKNERSRQALRWAIMICVIYGMAVFTVCQFTAPQLVAFFSRKSAQVAVYGGQYLRSYAFDCIFAGIHFCFSGYFCAYNRSVLSFVHNIAAVILVRVPGAYLASVYFPNDLYPMGLAAPLGSLLSVAICVIFFRAFRRYWE